MKRVLKWLLLSLAVALVAMAVLIYRFNHPANHYSEAQLEPFLDAKEWTVYSIDPSVLRDESHQDSFHGYLVLGSHRESRAPFMREVIQDLEDAAKRWTGGIVVCFNPRHGIRVSKDGKTFDLSICYECSRAHLYEGTQEVGVMHLTTDPQLEPSPEKLNEILLNAGVRLPLAPRHNR